MKTYFRVLVASLCFFGGTRLLWGAANPPAPGQIQVLPAPAPYAVTKRDANSRVWERTGYEQLPSGQIISRQYHYTELASGMHYQDAQGQWTESQEQIETYATGAIARQGQYQVIFANNLNTAGSIDMQTPDGKRLRSNILGLSYYDSSTGQSVLIAQIQDSQGELISSNQVLYPNVFAGVKADVRYTYKKGSFEQDVILREQPPTPESLGLNSQYTVIEVMTEFINPPMETINDFSGNNKIQADQDISWGAMRIGHGKAFDLDETLNQRSVVQVMKQYVSDNGRKVLLEKVPLPNITASLSKLPRQASIKSTLPMTASKGPQLPKAPLAPAQPKSMKLAVTTPSNKGYVLDFVVLNTDQSDFTFQGDTTYYITAGFNLTGTTTFEGGTVIKCDPGCQINIDAYGSVKCQTTAYRPAVFTSINDNSIGDPGYWTSDPHYTGTPSCGDVVTFLNVNCSSPVLGNMRFCYASKAIQATSSAGVIDLWDCQFMNASNCLIATAADVNLHNVLMSVVGGDYPIYISSSGNLTAENVTSDGCGSGNGLVHVDYPGTQTVILTNTLVTSGQYVSVNGGAFALSSNPIYQTVGGGSYYLTNNSPYRNAGTTNISATLLGELRQKTTWPPLLPYVNTTISSATSLSPQASRDTDTPDLGYHYDPLDYVIIGSDLTTNLTITAGTAVGFYDNHGYGLRLDDGANLTMTGTASAPCWITSYNTVQECGNGNWPISLGQGVIVFNGSGAAPIPQASATFVKWPAMCAGDAHIHGPGNFGVGTFVDCEFYGVVIASYRPSYYFTNCLFARVYTAYWDQSDAASFTYQNCTFYDGFLALCRYTGQSPSFWTIKNTMFDGTGFLHDDNFNASTNYTYFDYNAYNTNNNSSWVTYPSGYWSDPTLETIGAQDVFITNLFAWQSSWLGDFYQPTNSMLIDKGSPTADQVGLYHFTTQTNQVKETNSTVDIGYHYVATDAYGNPLDSNGNGIPDYLEDTSGVGQSLTVTLITPLSSAFYTEPATISIQASVFDWRSVVTNVTFLRGGSTQIAGINNTPFTDSWPVVAAGAYSLTAVARDTGGILATSAPVNITVTNLCSF